MSSLRPAHQGYAYQDLLIACRLVDVVLGTVTWASVDRKTSPGDCFDDLTTVDVGGTRERVQFKHTQRRMQPLPLAIFVSSSRGLRLDRVIGAALPDRETSGSDSTRRVFRIVVGYAAPTDSVLGDVLVPATVDPGPFVDGLRTTRLAFNADALWAQMNQEPSTGLYSVELPFAFLRNENRPDSQPHHSGQAPILSRLDLDWVCRHLVVEVSAPPSSGDLIEPAEAERLLLRRVQAELGAGVFPNADRSPEDVAAAVIATARAAREGRGEVTAHEILRRAQLRSDYGAVSRSHPVDKSLQVSRDTAVQLFADSAAERAQTGGVLLAVGPPGQGKSWLCQQVLEELQERGWLVAEHYCYLGDADHERVQRVLAERVFGSLVARLADTDERLVTENRPLLAADEDSLTACVARSLEFDRERRVALVVDGLDHVTRVRSNDVRGPDPSLSLAEALASLELPSGSVLIVLSQPGGHLSPFGFSGVRTVSVPRLDDVELRSLAAKRGLVAESSHRAGAVAPLLSDEVEIAEFLEALAVRSCGNALYATYMCREVLRDEQAQAGAAAIVMRLPAFDGTLESYYKHLHSSVEPEGAWVADVMALIDFSVTREELKAIRPDAAHRVDGALRVLGPVLVERAMQGGVRVYHESFARFLCRPLQDDPAARASLLNHIAAWLASLGFYDDRRAYYHLIPLLAEAGREAEVVEMISTDFVVRSVAAGFAASAITRNLARAVRYAARIGEWARVARYVELVRAARCYQRERFDSTLVDFADVPIDLLGPDAVAERLLHNDRTVMSARAGLQMCAAVDASGAVAPWQHYLDGFDRESERDNTVYGGDSDQAVGLAYLRGCLRVAANVQHDGPDQGTSPADAIADSQAGTSQGVDEPLVRPPQDAGRIDWKAVASYIEGNRLDAYDVISVILDTIGSHGVLQVVPLLNQSAVACLAVARHVEDRQLEPALGSARSWAIKAERHGTPAGTLHLLVSLGVDIVQVAGSSPEDARRALLSLTARAQQPGIQWESTDLNVWLDACTAAAYRDPLSLNAAEALITGEGWYKCWLRFTVGLARAEASSVEDRASLSFDAIQQLASDLNPFSGDPRACDLFSITRRSNKRSDAQRRW